MHSCVLHAAFTIIYNNFVARATLKWLHPLSCNTLRILSGFVIT